MLSRVLSIKLTLTLLILMAFEIYACTIVSGVDKNGLTWVGNNEDMFFHFETRLSVLPRSKNKLGAVIVTYNDGFPQGGINEKGLFFDINALLPTPLENYVGWDNKMKNLSEAEIYIEMIQKFATVKEAINYLDQYQIPDLLRSQMHLADAKGNLAIYSSGGACNNSSFQVSTNFRVCSADANQSLEKDDDRFWRFPIAQNTLQSKGINDHSINDVLSATSRKRNVSTIYSYVSNLDTTDTTLYYGGDFSKSYKFNVQELVDNGEKSIMMHELFPKSPLVRLWKIYKAEGVEAALIYFREKLTHLHSSDKQELLRHTFTSLLMDLDQNSVDYHSSKIFFDEWKKGKTNVTEGIYEGLFALLNGKMSQARIIFIHNLTKKWANKNLLQSLVDRIDGKIKKSNLHLELQVHKNATFVYVKDLSTSKQFLDFLTPTNTGWQGDFMVTDPKKKYDFVVDGVVVSNF